MVFFTARRMFSYPVQRHRWPERSLRSSSSVYSLPLSRISTAVMMKPGVQNPHWMAASSMKACWMSLSSPSGPMSPSKVRMCFPSAQAARYRQEL